jgi:hypothetical protein
MTTTKGNFSQAPGDALAAAIARNYISVHVEQGVPVLDRDLNLLGDVIAAKMRNIVQRHIGSGIADTADFAIQANGNPNDFAVVAGTCLVNGVEITLAANTTYMTQVVPLTASPAPPLPPLTTPAAARLDTVYLDSWLDEIDDSPTPAGDPTLGNSTDVGIRTSTRTTVSFCVRVLENAPSPSALPAAPTGHVYYALAQLSRQSGVAVLTPAQITDVRQKSLSMPVLEARIRTLEGLLAPTITSYSPEHVIAGQAFPITIVGNNFLVGTTQVLLGTSPGTIIGATSTNTSLVVHVPVSATPGTWQVAVQNSVGLAVATDPLLIDPPPPSPKFAAPNNQFTPTHAAPGATITLNGTDFLGVNRVTFNTATPVSALPGGDLLNVTATAIKVNVPAVLQVGQTCTIFVGIDGAPTMNATSGDLFTVDPAVPPPAPPAFGEVPFTPQTQTHGNPVTLNGTNFGTSTTTTQVQFTGTNTVTAAATDMVSVSPTQIVVKVPAGLTVATSPNNTATITVIVNGLPITSLQPLKVA